MVWDYCVARKLDPLKKPCHIVPMEVKVGNGYEWRDVVLPGIYEHRTTAQRTGQYLGHSKAVYGPELEVRGVKAPEWCEMTMYRWNAVSGQRVEFPVTVFFREVVATNREGKPNARWSKAPIQMLTKCTEAAGLREAFPDEIGGEPTAEEMDGQRAFDATVVEAAPALMKPDGFDEWLVALREAAGDGEGTLDAAWEQSAEPYRTYLATTDPSTLEWIRASAKPAEAPE
jgi:phage recombination protein Bet